MDNSGVLERVKVREVAGVFPSRTAPIPAMDDLLLAGSDNARILRLPRAVPAQSDWRRSHPGRAIRHAGHVRIGACCT